MKHDLKARESGNKSTIPIGGSDLDFKVTSINIMYFRKEIKQRSISQDN